MVVDEMSDAFADILAVKHGGRAGRPPAARPRPAPPSGANVARFLKRFSDGLEVALGSDPLDPLSVAQLPALAVGARLLLATLLVAASWRHVRKRRTEPSE